ncbi:hypothetical protein GOBAR_AA15448 [Gossypium barbadense]|uniref:NB-ARC domain-containing protein n=1 Tax=Gossypium barbadense TaxID=3634 RepID=A0A2P5XPF0_GOSBA|nr:hypothetical protein GOBAR_AA15448 [Gossypium barbadense]
MLPKCMKHLKNLRYLDLRKCDVLAFMPVGLGQLSCLHNLSKFVVEKDNDCGIDELKELALEGLAINVGISISKVGSAAQIKAMKQGTKYCQRCDQLPPLGKLRFLGVLTIKRMDALKHIGSSFYGYAGSFFPSLEVLEIRRAPRLEE